MRRCPKRRRWISRGSELCGGFHLGAATQRIRAARVGRHGGLDTPFRTHDDIIPNGNRISPRATMTRFVAVAGVAVLLAACDRVERRVDVGAILGAPNAVTMDSLLLPARLPEIQRSRPSTRRAPSGREEAIAGGTLRYLPDDRDLTLLRWRLCRTRRPDTGRRARVERACRGLREGAVSRPTSPTSPRYSRALRGA